ncbi:hypothetical protein MTO96_028614 [Rhipicephalus appendiculatus]
MAACAQVLQPYSTGVGGDCFALHYDAGTKEVRCVDGCGRSPAALTLELVQSRSALDWTRERCMRGLQATVPGAVKAWFYIADRFGSGKKLGKEGPRVLYEGSVAEDIAEAVHRAGGVMSTEDLADHVNSTEPLEMEPISTTYRDFTVHTTPLPTQGAVLLQVLNILEKVGIKGLQHIPGQFEHVVIEAVRLAVSDGLRYVADPTTGGSLEEMLSHKRAQDYADMVKLDRLEERDSTQCPGTRNCFGARKKPYHSLMPIMVTDAHSQDWLGTMGCMGGYVQPSVLAQLLLNMVELGLDPQQSLSKPRFLVSSHLNGNPNSAVALWTRASLRTHKRPSNNEVTQYF